MISEIEVGKTITCVGVKDTSVDFLQYLNKQQISLGTNIKVLEKEAFDRFSSTAETAITPVTLAGENSLALRLLLPAATTTIQPFDDA